MLNEGFYVDYSTSQQIFTYLFCLDVLKVVIRLWLSLLIWSKETGQKLVFFVCLKNHELGILCMFIGLQNCTWIMKNLDL